MSDVREAAPESGTATELQRERLAHPHTLRGQLQAEVRRVRGGDLGKLPVLLGLVLIWIIFQSLDPSFLSSTNLGNLTLEMVPVGVIALGVVWVLLLGQIDLSVGSVSGLAAANMGTVFVHWGQPLALGVLAGLATGLVVGTIYGLIYNYVGVPSFVITLGGLLAFQGAQLWVLRGVDGYNLGFDSALVEFATLRFVPDWLAYVLAVVAAGTVFVVGWFRAGRRRRANLGAASMTMISARAIALLILLTLFVYYLNIKRGVPWLFVFFIVLVLASHYVLSRTKFGRAVYAVGGNVEAARRAGINVRKVYSTAFVLCSTLAALGGILAAARLGAATQATGTGDVNLNAIAAAVIGGASLFGGRGSAFSALIGIIVIASISNGLTLLELGSSYRFMITGAVLLIAVALDSLARRSRQASGRG